MSVCFTTSTFANEQSDVAELEAFYHQVFNTKSLVKKPKTIKQTSIKSHNNKPLKANKIPVSNNKRQNNEFKDPELIAFYEMVFDEIENVPAVKLDYSSVKKIKIKNKNNKTDIKKPLGIPVKASLKLHKKDDKTLKLVTGKNKQTIINGDVSKNNTNKDTDIKKGTVVIESVSESGFIKNNQSNFPVIENSNKINHNKEKGTLNDNLLHSQSQKTDSSILFKKAFTQNKQNKKLLKTNTGTNANDLSSLFAKAFGKKSNVVVPPMVEVEFRVNEIVLGNTLIFSNSTGSFNQIKTAKLLELLKDVLKEHVYKRVEEQLINSKRTKFNALNELGISAIYNSINLSLDVNINPELRKPLILSLKPKIKASVREENKIKAEKVSGFLNAFTNVGLRSNNDETDISLRLEGSLNLNGLVLETIGDYRNEQFDLGQTTLTYDRPQKLQRFTFGNISTGTRNFQDNFALDGIRISKEFFFDPELQISPRADASILLETNSEVELYINNKLIRRFYLNAGVYSLEDIGLFNGANNISIKITDEFGKVTIKKSEQYYDDLLLKPGLSLFAISVGYLSNQQSFSNNDLEKSPIFSGYYQKGINENLTVSLDAQLNAENYLLGFETISSTPLGSLKNSFAASGGKKSDSGYATSFEFKPNRKQEQISLDTLREDLLGLDTRSRGFLNNWSITGEYRSKYFSELNTSNLTNEIQNENGIDFGSRVFSSETLRANIQTNFNLNISEKWQGNLNLGATDFYDADDDYFANLSATKRFDHGIRLSVGSRYSTEDKFSMNVQLSIPLSRKKGQSKIDFNALTDSRDNSYQTRLDLRPTSQIGKNSLQASLEHTANQNSKQQVLDLQYRSNLFESSLTARNRKTNGSNTNQQLDFGFNTSFACIGSSCAPSFPIDDSFAIVSGPSNQTQPIALGNGNSRFKYSGDNNTDLPDNYNALIPGKGGKAVVRLDSYRRQIINVDEGTLPNGYDSEKTEFSVFPKYHQGFEIKVGGEPATTIDGMLFDERNNTLGFKGGQWIPTDKGKTIAFFSNKGGKFRVTSIPEGKYKLELFDYPDMEPINIDVPDTKGQVHNIGNLVIKTPNG